MSKSLEEKLEEAAGKDTTADLAGWAIENYTEGNSNPLYGHCAIVALVIQDLFGGTLKNGRKGGLSHYWNVLPDGTEVDYTACQFKEMPEWEATTTAKQRDYVLSFPTTAERYKIFKARFEVL